MDGIAQVPKTALDVFRMLPEGTLCEVINNTLYMSPAPNFYHQDIVSLLITRIRTWTDEHALGKAIVSPVDVYFEGTMSALQPDIIFVGNKRMEIAKKDGIYGAPDIVVEVLSDDKKRDTVMKKQIYEQAGVQEYFIVDPNTKQVTRFDVQDGAYIVAYEDAKEFRSQILGLTFSL